MGLNNFGGKKAAPFTKGGSRAERVARAKKGLAKAKRAKVAGKVGNDLSVTRGSVDLAWSDAARQAAIAARRAKAGNKTENAKGQVRQSSAARTIATFQKRHGLPVTGKMDPKTAALAQRFAKAHAGQGQKALVSKEVNQLAHGNREKAANFAERRYAQLKKGQAKSGKVGTASTPKKGPKPFFIRKSVQLSNAPKADVELSTLTAEARDALPASDFVFPSKRAYPIHDKAHAENALARSKGKPEHAAVVAAVRKRYPDLGA